MIRRTLLWEELVRFALNVLAPGLMAGIAMALLGCATKAQTTGLGVAAVTALGAQSPSHEIEVIYYLGIFDPQDQIPPMFYRVRVHGQASFLSQKRFASGWVRSELVDSLNTGGQFSADGKQYQVDQANTLNASGLETGRRLVMFGPEGFREAPRDHRLVIVMSSSPEAYFEALDTSLSAVSAAKQDSEHAALVSELFSTLTQVKGESDRLSDLAANAAAAIPSTR